MKKILFAAIIATAVSTVNAQGILGKLKNKLAGNASQQTQNTNTPQAGTASTTSTAPDGTAIHYTDPAIIGTPITSLQIPPAVMSQITSDIQASKSSTKFTQDGLELIDLKSKISEDDFKCVTTVTSEVGYACPGCSNTFQQQSHLEAHQKLICQNFDGKTFKLLQSHYECVACNTRTGTQVSISYSNNHLNL